MRYNIHKKQLNIEKQNDKYADITSIDLWN